MTTYTAINGTAPALQAAVDKTVPGDTVLIPPGAWEFRGRVISPHEINIKGAGRFDTVLVKSDNLGEWKPMLSVQARVQIPFTISDFSMVGNGRIFTLRDQAIVLEGAVKNFRITRMKFARFGRAAITPLGPAMSAGPVIGEPTGLIDDCSFADNWFDGLGYGIEVIGHPTSWDRPLTLGGADAVFIERCFFREGRHTVAANNGARYVFRNNTIFDNRENAQVIDAHGWNAWPRGCRSYEVYANTIENTVTRYAACLFSGGSGVVFGNRVIKRGSKFSTSASVVFALAYPASGKPVAYPLKDQVSDLYIWDNDWSGCNVQTISHQNQEAKDYVQEGRDYFLFERPSYVPYVYPHPLATP